MIKTREIILQSDSSDITDILKEADDFATEMELSGKDRGRFRLLTEETTEMIRTITGEIRVQLSLIGKKDVMIIHLETKTLMDLTKREQLLAVSKSGKNESAKGIKGKLREAIELANMMPTSNPADAWMSYGSPAMRMGMPGTNAQYETMDAVYWTLESYRNKAEEESQEKEIWDELEKSIVGSMADDVRIGIRSNKVVAEVIMKIK